MRPIRCIWDKHCSCRIQYRRLAWVEKKAGVWRSGTRSLELRRLTGSTMACPKVIFRQASSNIGWGIGWTDIPHPAHPRLPHIHCSARAAGHGERVCEEQARRRRAGEQDQKEQRKQANPVTQAKSAVVVGAQWGDEGKGKIVDVLSREVRRRRALRRWPQRRPHRHHRRQEVRPPAHPLRRPASRLQRRHRQRRRARPHGLPEGNRQACATSASTSTATSSSPTAPRSSCPTTA